MKPKISILVPIYNVESYLQRCINSVLAQDFQDWEMILVDDGSPDQCPEICDEAARKDERITVVHKENGGLPSARLAGFEQAKADYLVFLDSDDWLLEGALTTLFNEIVSGDYDMVRSRPMRFNEKGKYWQETYEINAGEIMNNEEYVLNLLHNKIAPYLHSAIYKRILFSNDIFEKIIQGGIAIGEDWVANMLVSPRIHRFKVIDVSTYAYYVNNTSMMSTCILSPYYNLKVNSVLQSLYRDSSEKIKKAYEAKEIVGLINACFIYEIPFQMDWYYKIRKYIFTSGSHELKSLLPSNYLRFINIMPLFFCYARIYAFAKFVLKQKMKSRIVITNI